MSAINACQEINPALNLFPINNDVVQNLVSLDFGESLNQKDYIAGVDDKEVVLVQQARAGSRKALGKLFEKYHRKVLNFVKKRVTNIDDAQELVQDAFLQAQLNIERFNGDARFSTWVMGIALNIIRNHFNRSPQNRYNFVHDDVTYMNIPSTETPFRQIAWEQCIHDMGARFQGIEEKYQQVMLMIALDGVSYEDAAQKIGISVAAIKSRLFRARQMLKSDAVSQILDDE